MAGGRAAETVTWGALWKRKHGAARVRAGRDDESGAPNPGAGGIGKREKKKKRGEPEQCYCNFWVHHLTSHQDFCIDHQMRRLFATPTPHRIAVTADGRRAAVTRQADFGGNA